MALSKTLQTALNEQIQKEYYSSYLYLAMAAQLEAHTLPGMAQWTRIQSQEELGHAMKLFDHVVEVGGRVTLAAIPQPPRPLCRGRHSARLPWDRSWWPC